MSWNNPFWFASEELLTELLRAEIHSILALFATHPDLAQVFDLPEATVLQRAACFAVLAHRALMSEIYETFAGRQELSPSLGNEEKDVLASTRHLFDDDAPSWVLEANQAAELLPSRIYNTLPEPLRRGVGFGDSNSPEAETIRAAARELGSVQRIQALITQVRDQQLQRLERRWSAPISAISQSQTDQHPRTTLVTLGGQTRRMNKRQGWEQKLKLYSAIQNALNRDPSLSRNQVLC